MKTTLVHAPRLRYDPVGHCCFECQLIVFTVISLGSVFGAFKTADKTAGMAVDPAHARSFPRPLF